MYVSSSPIKLHSHVAPNSNGKFQEQVNTLPSPKYSGFKKIIKPPCYFTTVFKILFLLKLQTLDGG
jgi:hypothetical protein